MDMSLDAVVAIDVAQAALKYLYLTSHAGGDGNRAEALNDRVGPFQDLEYGPSWPLIPRVIETWRGIESSAIKMRTEQHSDLFFLNHTSFVEMHLSYIIAALLPTASWAVPATFESRQSEPECKYDYFTQKVDHFGKNDSTFQQKYSLSTEFYKPGGPIFYMQGAEGSPLGCIDTTAAISWAEEVGGAAVVLEHRYFGDSLPFNATNPREQLAEYQYLTLDNVLEDVTFFLDDLKTKLEGATDSKVITNGCSYPAWLMTIYQQTRAAKVHATIAQSTSVEGLITEVDHTFKYGVNNLANNIYRAQNYEAWEKISNGYQALHDAVHAADYDKLKSDFGLCELPNEETALNIRIYPGFVHLLATQYNYNTTGLPVKDPLNTMINIALDEQDPIKLLNRTVWTWMGPTGTKCLNVTDPQQGAYAGSGTGLQFGSFNYLNCAFCPGVSGGDYLNTTMFRFNYDSYHYVVDGCKERYNITVPKGEDIRSKYNITREDLQKSKRILWTGGEFDPENAMGPRYQGVNSPIFDINADRDVSRYLHVDGMGHCEDNHAPKDTDKETVKAARKKTIEVIRSWLEEEQE
ncbi:Lysosomal Pro-X carboxypeptidase [Cyphellophora attinorum]|uniref:Lysosomal Pro-X carboxypeptidase n=1 Tax=Cyphellophora attinorum TaxID=1664694 RepID=A0A0N0NMJ2_9EURO|nr:Lysosomal Pro-X carboxypeptidase [Phialophora attinorum]KPI40418.1 Lysosomal Pro-X carboxypeptidase [Phialophora attinorum]